MSNEYSPYGQVFIPESAGIGIHGSPELPGSLGPMPPGIIPTQGCIKFPGPFSLEETKAVFLLMRDTYQLPGGGPSPYLCIISPLAAWKMSGRPLPKSLRKARARELRRKCRQRERFRKEVENKGHLTLQYWGRTSRCLDCGKPGSLRKDFAAERKLGIDELRPQCRECFRLRKDPQYD